MSYFWTITAATSTLLQVLIIAAMQRRASYRQYPLLFLYCIVLFFSGVIETATVLKIKPFQLSAENFATYYWTNEAILQFLIFCVMISLIHRSMAGSAAWRPLVGMLSVVVLVVVLVSLLMDSTSSFGRRMTELSRNLSFFSALLNLVLWSALVRNRRKDLQLLLVSGGIGVQTAGKAIGHSLRVLGKSAQLGGNLLVVGSYLFCLFIWWWAFSKVAAPKPRQSTAEVVGFDPRTSSK